jgi:hypothetical protein
MNEADGIWKFGSCRTLTACKRELDQISIRVLGKWRSMVARYINSVEL